MVDSIVTGCYAQGDHFVKAYRTPIELEKAWYNERHKRGSSYSRPVQVRGNVALDPYAIPASCFDFFFRDHLADIGRAAN
jgi:hypothetical protein